MDAWVEDVSETRSVDRKWCSRSEWQVAQSFRIRNKIYLEISTHAGSSTQNLQDLQLRAKCTGGNVQ